MAPKGGTLTPGTIAGSYSSNNDNYSGGAIVGSPDWWILSPAVSNFDSRPPSQSNVDDIMRVYINLVNHIQLMVLIQLLVLMLYSGVEVAIV